MSYDPESGLRDAIQDVLEGIIVSAVLGIIPLIPNVPSYYVGIIQLLEAYVSCREYTRNSRSGAMEIRISSRMVAWHVDNVKHRIS
jgi:hypothetical protein